MKKKLREAIENIDMVNNIDGQDFDKEFVGTAPVSYADAVLRARKHREDAKKNCEEQTKLAEEVLKKEISNAEHPEPLDKIKVNEEGKMTLDEGLFESLSEDEHDVFTAKDKATEALNHLIQAMDVLEEISKSNLSEEARKKFRDVMIDVAQSADRVSYIGRNLKESFDDEHLGHGDDVCPKCGKEPCECKMDESVIRYPNGMEVTDIDLDKALDYQYGTDRDKDNSKYTDDEKQKAVTYWIKKTDTSPYDDSTDDLEELSEKLDWDSTIKVLKQHLSKIPKGAMSRANIRDVLVAYCNYSSKEANDFVAKLGVSGVRNLIDESLSKEEVEPLEESKEDAKVFRVTYKHSPEIFSSVMIKAKDEAEAKKKLSVKKPGKDIVGVSVMSDDEVSDMTNRGMSLMEAKVVDDFSSYEPWDAAVSTFDNIQNAGKMDALEQLIDDMYPDGIDKTELNDLLAYESDWVYSMLDMPSEEDVDEEEDGPAVDFDEEE